MAEAALTMAFSSDHMAWARSGGIVIHDVTKSYGSNRFGRTVVEACSFTVEPNRFTVIIGPSGAGKSTLVRLIAGFEKPDRGEILVGGRPVTVPGADRLVVFQESALFPWMSTRENIAYGPKARGEAKSQVNDRVEFLLDKVGLGAFRGRYPAQLSGGMQRRAELARALINNPEVMILDEPFRGLDAMTKRLMLEYYAALSQEMHRTDLFVTTDIDEAIFLADRLLVMSNIPIRMRAVFDVDLPRPRTLAALVNDNRANAIKMEALSLLHDEAIKAFVRGSRAASDFVEAYRRRAGSKLAAH